MFESIAMHEQFMQEIPFLEFMGGSNLMPTNSNYLICMCFRNTVVCSIMAWEGIPQNHLIHLQGTDLGSITIAKG